MKVALAVSLSPRSLTLRQRGRLYRLLMLSVSWLLATPCHADTKTPNWEKIGEDDGVVTYTRPISDDGVVSIRGEAIIQASIKAIVAVLKDNEKAKHWMPMVSERYELRKINPDHRIEYTRLRMPWPITDRYFIAEEMISELPNGGARITMTSLKDSDPTWLQPKLVMATFYPSEFVLTPTAKPDVTDFAFELHSETGGYVPKWLVKMGQRNWPKDLVKGLNGQLKVGESPANQK